MAKKAYIGIPEYTELAYIESTGTQYIDTGIIGRSGLEIYLDFEYTELTSTAQIVVGSSTSAVRVYPISSSGYIGYGDYYNLSVTLAANTPYNAYAKLYDGEQTVTINNATAYSETIGGNINSGYSMTLFAVNWAGEARYFANVKVRGCKILENGTLVRDLVPCQRSSGEVGMLDRVNRVFYGNKGTGVFVGGEAVGTFADGVAHKVKNMYIGVDGVARKIKKAYIGIGGVAHALMAPGVVTRLGQTNLSAKRSNFAATTIGDYALFGGGWDNPSSDVVDAFDKSLTLRVAPSLSSARQNLTAVTIGDYALFCSGVYQSSTTSRSSTVDAYDKALTRTKPSTGALTTDSLSSAVAGEYAIIAGGNNGTKSSNSACAYNKSLTRATANSLYYAVQDLSAATVGGKALFPGGYSEPGDGTYSYRSYVNVYDGSLTRTSAASLGVSRCRFAATVIGGKAIFCGGGGSSSYLSNVDAYDASLVHTVPTSLSAARRFLGAVTLEGFAIIGGGEGSSKTVDVYDESLVRTAGTPFITERYNYASAVIGDKALFAGGGGNRLKTIEVYTVQ